MPQPQPDIVELENHNRSRRLIAGPRKKRKKNQLSNWKTWPRRLFHSASQPVDDQGETSHADAGQRKEKGVPRLRRDSTFLAVVFKGRPFNFDAKYRTLGKFDSRFVQKDETAKQNLTASHSHRNHQGHAPSIHSLADALPWPRTKFTS